MASACVDALSRAPDGFNFGEPKMCDEEEWFCGLDFSDLPQLPIEADVADLPLLDDLFLLDETSSLDSVSSIWHPEDARSALHPQQNEDFNVTDEDLDIWGHGMTSSLFPKQAGSSNSDEDATPFHVEQASPDSSVDFSPKNMQCHDESAGTAHVGSASASREELRMPDIGVKAQVDPSQKKQMRLLRNRELAFESRQRKKSYIKELESKCRVLEQERNHLQYQILLVSSENTVLKEELSRVKRKKGSIGEAEPAALTDSLPLEFLSHLTCLFFLAWMSLLGNLYLDLSRHNLVFKVKAGGPVKGEVSNKASFFALRIRAGKYTSTELRKLCSFSFWRRRRKLYDTTVTLHDVALLGLSSMRELCQ